MAELRALRPGLALHYLADTAGFPYGDKRPAELAVHLVALLDAAIAQLRPCLVVLACNTASVAGLESLRARFDVPFVGCVPAIKWAASLSRTRCFGLLATPATVSRPYVADLVRRFAPDCAVLSHGARALAGLAEQRFAGQEPDPGAIAAELSGLLDQPGAERIDTIVLGCTHYRLLMPELRRAAPGVTWLDSAPAVARRAATLLDALGEAGGAALAGQGAGGSVLVTRLPADPRAMARRFLPHGFARLCLLQDNGAAERRGR